MKESVSTLSFIKSESSNHTYTIDEPLAQIVECEGNNTYSSKEVYSLYATEKPRLSQNSQTLYKTNPSQKMAPKIPLQEL